MSSYNLNIQTPGKEWWGKRQGQFEYPHAPRMGAPREDGARKRAVEGRENLVSLAYIK